MIYIVRINDNEYEVEVEKGKASIVKTTKIDETSQSEISATKDAPAPAQSTSGGKGEVVKAPMPGTVLDVKFSEGSRVKAGDLLLVLEAMKMENEVLSPKDGVVTKVFARKGDTVATNDQLFVIE